MTDVVSEKATRDGREGWGVVDVDVHEMLTSVKDLVPYLDEPWRGRVAVDDGFKGPPGNPYAFPQAAGVAIQDAITDDGSPAGSKLELLQEQVLGRYGIEPAVLISLFHPTDHQIQPEFAVALASAYNDWVLENWLEREERLRSSITVAIRVSCRLSCRRWPITCSGGSSTGPSSRPPRGTTSSSPSIRVVERGRLWGCRRITSSGTRP